MLSANSFSLEESKICRKVKKNSRLELHVLNFVPKDENLDFSNSKAFADDK